MKDFYFSICFIVFSLLPFSTEVVWAQGYLLAVGGGAEDSGNSSWNYKAYKLFAEQVYNDTLIVLSQNSNDLWLTNYFKNLGVSVVMNLTIETHTRNQIRDSLKKASGVFMKGGDQLDYIRAWKNTEVEYEIQQIFAKGGVIGGTSAGAMVLGEFISTGSPYSFENLENPFNRFNSIEKDFFNLITGFVFDTHYFERGRFGRLLGIISKIELETGRSIKGIGVDDKTAVWITPERKMYVFGSGAVHVIHGDKLIESTPALSARGIKVDQLIDGYVYDLEHNEVIEQPERATIHSVESMAFGFWDFLTSVRDTNLYRQLIAAGENTSDWLYVGTTKPEILQSFVENIPFRSITELTDSTDLQTAKRIFVDLSLTDLTKWLENPSIKLYLKNQSRNNWITFPLNQVAMLSKYYINNLTSDKDASYYGDFQILPGADLLNGYVTDRTYADNDFFENRTTSGPFLLYYHPQSWYLQVTGLNRLTFSGYELFHKSLWQRNGTRVTPAVLVQFENDFSAAQSPFSFASHRRKRHAVSLTGGTVAVIPSDSVYRLEIPSSIDVEQLPQKASQRVIESVLPNPFNPETQIKLTDGIQGAITISVYSVLGQKVFSRQVDRVQENVISLNLAKYPSGVYIIKVQSKSQLDFTKVTLIK